MTIIAADVGGTKTHMAIVDPLAARQAPPAGVLFEAIYPSQQFSDFTPLLQTFIEESGAPVSESSTLSLALPGVVDESRATLTNLPWVIRKQGLKDTFHFDDVLLMNDFQASASGIASLSEQDMLILNAGNRAEDGIQVVVGAGTGLGVAWLEKKGQAISTHATEGGHMDFAPVNAEQINLLTFLLSRYSHVSYERLLSGAGLSVVYEFVVDQQQQNTTMAQARLSAAEVVAQAEAGEVIAAQALRLFVEIYGAYIGNLALLFKPAAGLYITGGVAAKIQPWMQSTAFLDAYLAKGRMRPLVERIQVSLVTNENVGLMGALSEAIAFRSHQESTGESK